MSSGRSPRPASLTAENVSVITAAEIAALNAHTLTDILLAIPGVQTIQNRTPGTVAPLMIQGSKWNHVLVLVDNVPINNLSDDVPDISSIPAQIIERVEVVKGAASSSWGSALGGVINVITKLPNTDRPVSGEVSASVGRSSTNDDRGELAGTAWNVGYYVSGGRLHSEGLLPNNHVDLDHVYGKFRHELSSRTSLTLSSLYTNNTSGQGVFSGINADQEIRQLLASATLESRPSDRLSLEGSVKTRMMNGQVWADSGGTVLQRSESDETSIFGCLNAGWRGDQNRISAGVDFEDAKVHVQVQRRANLIPFDRQAERVGVYFNDAFTVGRLALIPSVRYDHTGTGGELFSPSFGVTYALSDNSVLRGYTGRGYSINTLGSNDNTEKVWTSQVGFETGEIPYLWLKTTLFRNDTWNIGYAAPKAQQLKQGVEIEFKTLPVFHSSLSAGYTFIDSRDDQTHQRVPEVPHRSVKVGITYDNPSYFRALLIGNYVDWNANAGELSADDMLWDLHVGRSFAAGEGVDIELFFSIHNIFNGKQFTTLSQVNPGRWAEAGFRCRF
ncbi:TonB-dependent receptor [Geomonas sp. Red875]|uniref:TonB-dependent receptor n=1 Tax=Geomesophilobacter sediminis TaxID=2798584 RepID=A0A8J7JAM8_9BACT|nr:TonB-dependent receptor [Geomesophilobacter sediminis]